jgi:hypothetical protein
VAYFEAEVEVVPLLVASAEGAAAFLEAKVEAVPAEAASTEGAATPAVEEATAP